MTSCIKPNRRLVIAAPLVCLPLAFAWSKSTLADQLTAFLASDRMQTGGRTYQVAEFAENADGILAIVRMDWSAGTRQCKFYVQSQEPAYAFANLTQKIELAFDVS